MRTVRAVAELREALTAPRRTGAAIGLVPTMGAFHEGHLSLMRRARSECDVVVVSLFVNPRQFNESSDLEAYPRDENRDIAQAEQLGVDYLFAPAVGELYPPGFATTVSVGAFTATLEGVARGRQHFDGVTTVVTKLFNIVAPDVAYFGQKDAQQALVIKQLARDLDMPVAIEVCPTVREDDGLAMSSRNALLSPEERDRARALHRALLAAGDAVAHGVLDSGTVYARALSELSSADIEPEYLALVAPDTLEPVERIDGEALALVAARIGATRLIDNHRLSTSSVAGSQTNNGRP
jgi:pantoate--beta-alanine ligase